MVIWKFCKFGLKRLFPPPKFAFLGIFDPKHYFSSSRPSKAHPWANPRRLSIHREKPSTSYCCRRRQEKREAAISGADPVGLISTKIGKIVGVHDVMIHSNFWSFRSQGVKISVFPLTLLVIVTTVLTLPRAACDLRIDALSELMRSKCIYSPLGELTALSQTN